MRSAPGPRPPTYHRRCLCSRRVLSDGETVSASGTHLGHNLPDRSGNRYCINLVSIAGRPAAGPTTEL